MNHEEEAQALFKKLYIPIPKTKQGRCIECDARNLCSRIITCELDMDTQYQAVNIFHTPTWTKERSDAILKLFDALPDFLKGDNVLPVGVHNRPLLLSNNRIVTIELQECKCSNRRGPAGGVCGGCGGAIPGKNHVS